MSTFKIIAWNVNGIRALTKKENLQEYLNTHKPHIFCMGETKLSCPDVLERKKLNACNLRSTLCNFQLMSFKLIMAIYWEALKLFLKGIKYVPYKKS